MSNNGIHIKQAHTPYMGAWSVVFSITVLRDGKIFDELYTVQDNGVWLVDERIADGRKEAHDVLADILRHASVVEPSKMTPREFWFYVDGWCQGFNQKGYQDEMVAADKMRQSVKGK